jgi:hypothetical protein
MKFPTNSSFQCVLLAAIGLLAGCARTESPTPDGKPPASVETVAPAPGRATSVAPEQATANAQGTPAALGAEPVKSGPPTDADPAKDEPASQPSSDLLSDSSPRHSSVATPRRPPEESMVHSTSLAQSGSTPPQSRADAPKNPPDLQTWTDVTGKHKVEAAFVDLNDGAVRMKKANGRVISIGLASLSELDRKRAEGIWSGYRLEFATIELEATFIDREARWIKGESKGSDERDPLAKSIDGLTIAQWKSPQYSKNVLDLTVASMNRKAAVLEAKREGKDIRNDAERIESDGRFPETLPAAYTEADSKGFMARKKYLDAQGNLSVAVKERERLIQESKEAGKDIRSEMERACDEFYEVVVNTAEYGAARKRLQDAGGTVDSEMLRSTPERVARKRVSTYLLELKDRMGWR